MAGEASGGLDSPRRRILHSLLNFFASSSICLSIAKERSLSSRLGALALGETAEEETHPPIPPRCRTREERQSPRKRSSHRVSLSRCPGYPARSLPCRLS